MEKTNKILSVVIPTYNMDKYLDRCLHSCIVNINTPEQDVLEIIVVNDGSTDKSLSIAQKYQNDYPNVLKIIDKKNGNYGSCINASLKIARGKYIKILDADDWFNSNAFDQFIKEISSVDSDLLITDYTIVYASGKKESRSYDFLDNGKSYHDDIFLLPQFSLIQMHAVTYKTEMLRKMGYCQSEGISYTDFEWIVYPMVQAHTVVYLKLNLYQYYLGREGQTMDPHIERSKVGDKVKILQRLIRYYNTYERLFASQERKYIFNKMMDQLRNVYKIYLLNCMDIKCKKELLKLDEFIKSYLPLVYNEMNEFVIHRFLPFHFVHYWRRRHTSCPYYIRILNLYMKKMQLLIGWDV